MLNIMYNYSCLTNTRKVLQKEKKKEYEKALVN